MAADVRALRAWVATQDPNTSYESNYITCCPMAHFYRTLDKRSTSASGNFISYLLPEEGDEPFRQRVIRVFDEMAKGDLDALIRPQGVQSPGIRTYGGLLTRLDAFIAAGKELRPAT